MEGEASLRAFFFAVVAGKKRLEFFGRLIEKMAEVGSWSSITSNHEIEIVHIQLQRSTCTVKLEVYYYALQQYEKM